jgi:protein SCO1
VNREWESVGQGTLRQTTDKTAMPARRNMALILLALGAAAAGAVLANDVPQRSKDALPQLEAGRALPEPRALPEFSLLDHEGRPFGRANFAGQWTLVFAGFTHCPDICPTTLATLAGVDDRLREQGVEIQTLMLTVDPKRDDPATLAQYVTHFSTRIIAATGDESEIDRLMDGLGFSYIKVPMGGGNYTVDHSAALALVDPRGRVAAYFMPPLRPAVLATDLAALAGPRP